MNEPESTMHPLVVKRFLALQKYGTVMYSVEWNYGTIQSTAIISPPTFPHNHHNLQYAAVKRFTVFYY